MKRKIFAFSFTRLSICFMWLVFLCFLYFYTPNFINVGNSLDKTSSLIFHTVDVGQGDCTIIEFPDDKVLMVDTGTKDKYPRVKNYLNKLDIKTIDWFVNTHPDADHYGGLPMLINDFDINTLYRSAYQSSNATFLQIEDKMFVPSEMQTIFGRNYIITFVSPYESDMPKISNSNDSSLMITIEYFDKIFILTGDASSKMETLFISRAFMVNKPQYKQVILKVGHHGSSTSSSMDFLDFIFDPKDKENNFAIISCGTTYGHPSSSTMERLKKKCNDDNIFITKEVGNIVFKAKENSLTINDKDNKIIYNIIFLGLGIIVVIFNFYNYKSNKTQYIDIIKK